MGVPCTAGCYEEVLGAEGLLAFSVPDVLSTLKPQQLGPFNNDMTAGAENKTSQRLGAGFVTTHASKDHGRKKASSKVRAHAGAAPMCIPKKDWSQYMESNWFALLRLLNTAPQPLARG